MNFTHYTFPLSIIILRQLSYQKRNFNLLYLEACLATFTGIAGAFCGAFAVRLGASNTLIGLMNSVPSMLVILVSIPFGRILQKSSHKMAWAIGGISLYRLGYMLFALAPLFSASSISPAVYFVALFALVAIPIQFYNIGTVGLMIDIVPEDRRAAVFTTRSILSTLVSIAGVFLAGQWLNRHPFPGNYQALFLVAGLVAFLNLFAWLGLRYPASAAAPPAAGAASPGLSAHLADLLQVFRGQPMFTRFMLNSLLLNLGQWMAGPLYILYTVRQLGATDAWIGELGTLSSICGLLGWLLGRQLAERWGDLLTQRRVALLLGLYPLLVGLFPSLPVIMLVASLYNLLTPSFSLSNYNVWLKIVPAQRREDDAAINNTLMSIGASLFPLLGVALAGRFSLSGVIIACGLLTLFGALSWWLWQIRLAPAADAV